MMVKIPANIRMTTRSENLDLVVARITARSWMKTQPTAEAMYRRSVCHHRKMAGRGRAKKSNIVSMDDYRITNAES